MRGRAAGGVGVGLAMSVLTRLMLKFIHRRGHKAPEQLTLTIAMAYLTYYFGQLAGRALRLEVDGSACSTLLRCVQQTLFYAPPPIRFRLRYPSLVSWAIGFWTVSCAAREQFFVVVS